MHRTTIPCLLLLTLCSRAVGQGTSPIDTGSVVANIDQYMMLVDRSPIMASYARMTPDGPAEPVARGSAMPPGCVEFIELMVDSARHVTGAVTYKAQRAQGVKEATFHYFDAQHNTVAVRHELKWLNNHCTFNFAVRNDFHYFFPPRRILLEYTTLTDVEGNNLEPTNCVFPEIAREMEMYNNVDMFLLMERVKVD